MRFSARWTRSYRRPPPAPRRLQRSARRAAVVVGLRHLVGRTHLLALARAADDGTGDARRRAALRAADPADDGGLPITAYMLEI